MSSAIFTSLDITYQEVSSSKVETTFTIQSVPTIDLIENSQNAATNSSIICVNTTMPLEMSSSKKVKRLRTVRHRNSLRASVDLRNSRTSAEDVDSTSSNDSRDVHIYYKPAMKRRMMEMEDQDIDIFKGIEVTVDNVASIIAKRHTYESLTKPTKHDVEVDLTQVRNRSSESSNTSYSDKLDHSGMENVDTTSGITTCPLCESRSFGDIDLLIFHLLQGHNLVLNDEDIMKLKYLMLFKRSEVSLDSIQTPKFSRPFNPNSKSKKKKSPPQKVNFEKCVISTEPKSDARDGGILKCLKCNCCCETEDDFFVHIKSQHIWTDEAIAALHNNMENQPAEFWCPECSSAFITRPSLEMHVKARHDFIQDVTTYMENLGYAGDIPMVEYQCDICYMVLDGSPQFERHLRTHGMAFLRRQKLLAKIKEMKPSELSASS